MKLALIGQGYWGTKIAKECYALNIQTDVFEIGSDISGINPKTYNGVIVATPAEDHANTTIQLLKNQNNILVEKPIAQNSQELKRICNAITNQKVMVGHILLYNNLYKKIKPLIKNLKYVHVRRNAWGRFKKNITPILNLAPHDVALFDDLFKRNPLSVYSHGVKITGHAQPDVVYCFLDYGSQHVTLELGWYNHEKVRETNFVCDTKHIVWNDLDKSIWIKELFLDENKRQQQGPSHQLHIDDDISPLQNQIKAFQDYVMENKLPISNLNHANRVTKIVDALEESYNKGTKICL